MRAQVLKGGCMYRMKNVNKPTFCLNNKVYTLKFDDHAIAAITEQFGSLASVIEALGRRNMIAFYILCWAGMLHEYPSLQFIEIGDLFNTSKRKDGKRLSLALIEALEVYGISANKTINELLNREGGI